MSKAKAKAILKLQLKEIKNKPYEELKKYIGQSFIKKFEITEDGKDYWGDIQVFWDDKPNDNIRVAGYISYSLFTSFVPVCDSLILTPENKFL